MLASPFMPGSPAKPQVKRSSSPGFIEGSSKDHTKDTVDGGGAELDALAKRLKASASLDEDIIWNKDTTYQWSF